LTLRGIDKSLRFLWCEVTLLLLNKRRKFHGPGLRLLGQYQPQDFRSSSHGHHPRP
jgi:hypothetical protein